MKKNVLLCSIVAICFSGIAFAESEISLKTLQTQERVCKGKNQNDAVTWNNQGVIFNGTCQPTFIPEHSRDLDVYAGFSNQSCELGNQTTITYGSQDVRGKCVLAYKAPQPIAQSELTTESTLSVLTNTSESSDSINIDTPILDEKNQDVLEQDVPVEGETIPEQENPADISAIDRPIITE
ncbi:MAG: hypothetical protein LKF82_00280 [Acinetobacter populi]|jgi:hypothetical protein|uniref:hypothetical protein n=1 Tax=Acinetobacter populi TaxID=1582270 RepID=UPI0023546F74|nr:hypothetical protein [Acinetobacter populi]MCH4246265.1 hypothetical protein [Acinetobacter populi]